MTEPISVDVPAKPAFARSVPGPLPASAPLPVSSPVPGPTSAPLPTPRMDAPPKSEPSKPPTVAAPAPAAPKPPAAPAPAPLTPAPVPTAPNTMSELLAKLTKKQLTIGASAVLSLVAGIGLVRLMFPTKEDPKPTTPTVSKSADQPVLSRNTAPPPAAPTVTATQGPSLEVVHASAESPSIPVPPTPAVPPAPPGGMPPARPTGLPPLPVVPPVVIPEKPAAPTYDYTPKSPPRLDYPPIPAPAGVVPTGGTDTPKPPPGPAVPVPPPSGVVPPPSGVVPPPPSLPPLPMTPVTPPAPPAGMPTPGGGVGVNVGPASPPAPPAGMTTPSGTMPVVPPPTGLTPPVSPAMPPIPKPDTALPPIPGGTTHTPGTVIPPAPAPGMGGIPPVPPPAMPGIPAPPAMPPVVPETKPATPGTFPPMVDATPKPDFKPPMPDFKPSAGVGTPANFTKPGGSAEVKPNVPEPTPQTGFDVDLHDPKANDSYESISQEFYNDRKYAAALKAFNRNQPLTGVKLVEVPPIHILKKRYPSLVGYVAPAGATGGAPTSAPQWGPVGDKPDPVPARASGAYRNTYVIPAASGGMSMKGVAKLVLGSEQRWMDLYYLNPSYKPEDLLPPGTELQLPADVRPPR